MDKVNSHIYGKVPPQATEVESAVLGAILLERDALDVVGSILRTADVFYSAQNKEIYASMLELMNKGYPVDLHTVTQQLQKRGSLEAVGGAYYVSGLAMDVVNSANIESHSRIILEKYMQREAIKIAGEVISTGYDDTADAFDLINKAQNQFEELTGGLSSSDSKSIGDVTISAIQEVEEERYSQVEPGAHIGIKALRDILKYWRKGDTVVLAARPGTGKTACALDIAKGAAMYEPNPVPVGILSMEMKDVQLAKRLHANIGSIAMDKISQPKDMSEYEIQAYRDLHKKLQNVPIYIDQEPALNINQVCAKARKMKRKNNIGILIIDYLQLMDFGKETIKEGLTRITRRLKQLAKQLDITIIELSQLNREIEKRAGAKPILSDLKESGSIEEDADIIIFLSLPTAAEIAEDYSMKDKVVFSVAKFRNGKPQDDVVTFRRQYQRFESDDIEQNSFTQTPNPRAGIANRDFDNTNNGPF